MKKHDSNNGRFYEVDGEYLPSATTILEAYPLEYGLKKFFQDNSEKEAKEILESAGLTGSKIHHAIELMFRGETIKPSGFTAEQVYQAGLVEDELINYLHLPLSEREDTMLRGFLNWSAEFEPTPIELEKTVISKKHKFAGTLDFYGTVKIKDETVKVIIDWKTGKGVYKSYDLQVASYLEAMKEMGVKDIEKCYLVQFGVNKCGYKMVEIKDPEEDFNNFLHVKALWELQNPNAGPKEYSYLDSYKIHKDNQLKKNNEGNKIKPNEKTGS